MTLIPTEEWLRMFIPDKSIEAIILLYDTADRDGYEALKPVDGKVLGYVKIPPKVQATRSWKSMWRLAREKLQPQPQIVEPPPPPIFLVAISVPWHESTDKVTREQGEELCEILGGTFVELTGKRFPDQEYLSETTKRLFGDLVSRAILRKIKSAQLTKKG